MSFRISYAQPPLPDDMWDVVAECLEPAVRVAGGRYELDDIRARVLAGHYGLFLVENSEGDVVAAMTASIARYPRLNALSVSFLGGSQAMLWGKDMLAVIENLAQAAGCSRVEFRGRKEWGKVLEKDGYRVASTLYEKVIDPCGTAASGSSMAH